MQRSSKVYRIIDCSSGEQIYSCQFEPEATRVFELICFIRPDLQVCLNIELRKA